MTSSRSELLAGLALIIGALIYSFDVNLNHLIPALLITVGILGFHHKQAAKAGMLGVIGLILLVTALIIEAIFGIVELFAPTAVQPIYTNTYLLIGLALLTGVVIYGVAILRARIYPRILGWALILIPVLLPFSTNWSVRLTDIAFIAMGLVLLLSQVRHGFNENERTLNSKAG